MVVVGAVVVVALEPDFGLVVVVAGAFVVVGGGVVVVVVGAQLGRQSRLTLGRRRRCLSRSRPCPSEPSWWSSTRSWGGSWHLLGVVVVEGVTGTGHAQDRTQFELGRAADQLLGAGPVLDAGKLDDHALALPGDVGLGHTQPVHPLADDVLGLLHGFVRRLLAVD